MIKMIRIKLALATKFKNKQTNKPKQIKIKQQQ